MNINQYKIAETPFGKVRYIDIGPTDGQVILFSTGGGAGITSVYAFTWLAKEGFRIICVNRPGYYDMPVAIVDSIEAHADIYHAVITFLNIKGSINVFGVSMGGLSALYYAQKYPTKALVLWSAITGKYIVNKDAVKSSLGRLVLSNSGKKIISFFLRFSAKLFPKSTIQSFLKTESNLNKRQRQAVANHVVNNPESKEEFNIFIQSMLPMDAMYTGMMDEVEKATQLGKTDWSDITCPVFAVHSTADTDVPTEHAKRLEQTIPNITMKYVVAGGHFVWWGKEGEAVKDATKQFFNRHNKNHK